MCYEIQAVGFLSASVVKCHEQILDLKVETVEMQYAFPQPRVKDFTISLGGSTFRNFAGLLIPPFGKFDGKTLISRNESFKEIQPNAPVAHIHLSTEIVPTIGVLSKFLSTVVLTNLIPLYDYTGQIQSFATTTKVSAMAHSTAILDTTPLNVGFSFLYYIKQFIIFAASNLTVSFVLWIGFKTKKCLKELLGKRRQSVFIEQKFRVCKRHKWYK